MAKRQNLGKLQSASQINTVRATPIDAFAPAPQVPKVDSTVLQITDALNITSDNVARYYNRKAQKEKAIFEQIEQDKIPLYASQILKEKDQDVVSAVQAKEIHATASTQVTTGIATFTGKREGYKLAKMYLEDIPEDVKNDAALMQEYYDGLQEKILGQYSGMEFVQVGALEGVQKAIAERDGAIAAERDTALRLEADNWIKDEVYESLESLNREDWPKAVDIIDKHHNTTNALNRGERKIAVVNSWVQFAVDRDNIEILESLRDAGTWLQGAETDAKIRKGMADISANVARKQDRAAKQKKLDDDLFIENKKQEIFNHVVNGGEIDYSKLTDLPTQITDYAYNLDQKSLVGKRESASSMDKARDAYELAFYTGDFSKVMPQLPDGAIPSDGQINDFIDNDTSMTIEDGNKLKELVKPLRVGLNRSKSPEAKHFYDNHNVSGAVKNFNRKIEGGIIDKFDKSLDLDGEVQGVFYNTVNRLVANYYKSNPDTLMDASTEQEIFQKAAGDALERFNMLISDDAIIYESSLPFGLEEAPSPNEIFGHQNTATGEIDYYMYTAAGSNPKVALNKNNYRKLSPTLDADLIQQFNSDLELENANSIKEKNEQDRIASLPLNESEQLDRSTQTLTLNDNQQEEIRNLLAGLGNPDEDDVLNTIANVLGVRGDSDYMYNELKDMIGGETVEETALRKLVQQYLPQ
tara:strand:- start:2135 stop:4225 length:2091 start_codon:yes stop_codon:yes gene_type:complete